MKHTSLGRTGMKVSRLALGTMNFGPYTDEKDSFAIMDRALEAGVNFFDTADVYGGEGHRGHTEEIIGRWFAQGGGRRESVILATKVYNPTDNPHDGPNMPRGMSAFKIRRHLEESLKRLQTDHIELYQMHHVDRKVSWEEIWGAYKALAAKGDIFYAGSSNFAGWDLMKAQAAADKRNFLGLVSEQHKYNLLCRLPELELLPAAKDLGIGVIPWSPLGGGLLSGNALHPAPDSRFAKRGNTDLVEKHRVQLEAFAKLAREAGEKEADIALAWLLANPAVTAPIIGPRTLEQFNNALRAVEISLSPDIMGKLDEIFPGPGGSAPEAYAW